MGIWLGLLAWVSLGPILAVVMGRRGHSAAGWGFAGLMLGPLVVPAAIEAARRSAAVPVEVVVGEGGAAAPGPGPVAVLAAIDGSAEALAALERAVTLLGDRVGRLALVTVMPLESVERPGKAWLEAAAATVPGLHPEELLATGEPAAVLARMAQDGHYDLLVAGPTGRGLSPHLFGSVARALAASSPVPLLLGARRVLSPAAGPEPR